MKNLMFGSDWMVGPQGKDPTSGLRNDHEEALQIMEYTLQEMKKKRETLDGGRTRTF